MDSHNLLSPSAWVQRFAPLIPGGGTVLDLACGTGRHSRLLAELGYQVEAVDKNEEALSALAGVSRITTRAIDLEDGEWSYRSGQIDGVVVTNYLFRS